jgi:hypothetical protein
MVDLLWSPHLTPLNFLRYIELRKFEETMRGTGAKPNLCEFFRPFEDLLERDEV